MKRRILLFLAFTTPYFVFADDYHFTEGTSFSRQLFEIPATLLAAWLLISFLISIVRLVLDNRLKVKMVEKEVSDKVAEQMLQSSKTDTRSQAFKWFMVLAGTGIGLGLVSINLPFGIHSIAILACCLSLSYLGYFIYIKRSEKSNPDQ
jgi:hypothetical protein